MESVWEKTAVKPQFDAPCGNKKTDVLIVGGGIAGILCAYKLKNAGVESMPNVFVATGFNKWGMTNAMVSADILCDLVQEKRSPYAAVFDPSRTVPRPQLAVNAFESTVGILTPHRTTLPPPRLRPQIQQS